jgi:ATP-dependent Clp protease protease subunit
MKNQLKRKIKNQDQSFHTPIVRGYTSSLLELSYAKSIFLSSPIDDQVAADFCALLMYYDHMDDKENPIDVYCNTPGGSLSGLNMMLNFMGLIETPIRTICMGRCYSAGSVILAAGDERLIFANAEVLLHQIQLSFPTIGEDASDTENYFNFTQTLNTSLLKMLSKYTGQPLSKIRADTERDLFLTAPDALEYGLVDFII